ncbi:MAG: FAD:protein FMN transferase [Acidobacteria bacterium]|nr:FAD:protein FMN transferase [Acidobacteriota bacterium]
MKQFMVLLLVALHPGRAAELLRLESSTDAMGGAFTVIAYGEDRAKLQNVVGEALDEVRRLDLLLSNYKVNSEWSDMNRRAPREAVPVPRELFQLLARSESYSRSSNGAFDLSVGPLMRVWGFYKGSGRFPHTAEVRGALAAVGYQKVQLDPANSTVRYLHPKTELDPGGIGKGYAVDRAVQILRASGVSIGFVSAAGSSLYGLGAPPGEKGWRVWLRHPIDNSRTVARVELKDQSMSTSGNYEKFFRVGAKVYSHIMDPRTGYPSTGMLSVSVISPECTDSEAWTKPVYINGRPWAAKNLPKGFSAFLCEDGWDVTCAWLQ